MDKNTYEYRRKYYKKQDYITYKLDEDKILSEFPSFAKFGQHVGVSKATINSYRTGKVYIMERGKYFENIKDYIVPDGKTFQEHKRERGVQ